MPPGARGGPGLCATAGVAIHAGATVQLASARGEFRPGAGAVALAVYGRERLMYGKRITYEQACRQNWPAYTCRYCYMPILWDRDMLCPSCIADMKEGFYDHLTTTKK